MLMPLSRSGMEERNLDFAAALAACGERLAARGLGEDQSRGCAPASWCRRRTRHSPSRRSRTRASDPAFVQILMSPRSSDPLGHRRYWPIFAAAERASRPIGLHVQGYSGGHASTGSGWPTYYMQEHYAMVGNMQAVVTSLIFEGVFERFPGLQDRADRGRLRLGAVALLADGQALGAHAQGNPACETPAVRISARAFLVHHAADRGTGKPAATLPRSWNWSAMTG